MTAANALFATSAMTMPSCCGTATASSCAYQQAGKMHHVKDTLAVSFLLTLICLSIRLHLVVGLLAILLVVLHGHRKTLV